jgi:cell division protein FtsL
MSFSIILTAMLIINMRYMYRIFTLKTKHGTHRETWTRKY